MLDEALQLAISAHDGQVDKSGNPYIFHPIRVAMNVWEHGETCRIVAFLHDVVEDNDSVGLDDILALFGEEVRAAVDALTRREGESYPCFIERCKKNEIAKIVKIADVNDNLRPGTPHLAERYKAALRVLTND